MDKVQQAARAALEAHKAACSANREAWAKTKAARAALATAHDVLLGGGEAEAYRAAHRAWREANAVVDESRVQAHAAFLAARKAEAARLAAAREGTARGKARAAAKRAAAKRAAAKRAAARA